MVKWWYSMVIPWYNDLYMLINIWRRETVQIERWYFVFMSFSPTFCDVWACFMPIFTSTASVSHNSVQWSVHRATANFTFTQHLTIALLFLVPTKMPQTHFNKSRCWWGFRELSLRRNFSCVEQILLYYYIVHIYCTIRAGRYSKKKEC